MVDYRAPHSSKLITKRRKQVTKRPLFTSSKYGDFPVTVAAVNQVVTPCAEVVDVYTAKMKVFAALRDKGMPLSPPGVAAKSARMACPVSPFLEKDQSAVVDSMVPFISASSTGDYGNGGYGDLSMYFIQMFLCSMFVSAFFFRSSWVIKKSECTTTTTLVSTPASTAQFDSGGKGGAPMDEGPEELDPEYQELLRAQGKQKIAAALEKETKQGKKATVGKMASIVGNNAKVRCPPPLPLLSLPTPCLPTLTPLSV